MKGLILVAVLFVSGSAFSAESCMQVACRMGHCRYHSDAVLKACADASGDCVQTACNGNLDCKYESDFVHIAESCSSRPIILVVPQEQSFTVRTSLIVPNPGN